MVTGWNKGVVFRDHLRRITECINAASASSSAASATQEQFVHDDDAVATEDFGYKFDGMGFIRPDTHWHLFAASADGTSETQLTDGEYDYLHAAWAPDSKRSSASATVSAKDRKELAMIFC